jgi:hypothetical protein
MTPNPAIDPITERAAVSAYTYSTFYIGPWSLLPTARKDAWRRTVQDVLAPREPAGDLDDAA